MKGIKRLFGLWKEDLKNKLWMIVAAWYLLGMFCLLFSTKMTIPAGEVRSLYVGPSNTSFFAAMVALGILMGADTFRYLRTEQQSDLYLSLPFSRNQLFAVGYLNNFLIFSVPAVICKIIFFRISLSMGYCRYEDSVFSVQIGCLVLVLGFLFVMSLSMLATFWARSTGYIGGLLVLFLFGPGAGLELAEKMLRMFDSSFYRSETMEMLKGYLSPISLLKNVTGIEEYVDGSDWIINEHLSYLVYLAVVVMLLLFINMFFFYIRPVERKSGAFTFPIAQVVVRYVCVILAVLWFVNILQFFSFGVFSWVPVIVGMIISVPLVHGLLNIVIACDAKRFLSGKWHLLAETLMIILLLGAFSLWGRREEMIPAKEDVTSMAVVLTALKSGDDSEQVLKNMQLTDEEMLAAYDWINEDYGEKAADYEVLVKYEEKNGNKKYCKYQLPWYALDGFEMIFAGQEYKEGIYQGLRMDSMKYYEICWSNGIENYTLDLKEEERENFLEAYREDADRLTFSDIRRQTPIGRITFTSTKNQGDVTANIYPGFTKVLSLLEEYGVTGEKGIKDYEINKIVVDKYMLTRGLLYDVNSLEWEKTITDEASIKELAKGLFCEEFCEDYLLNEKNLQIEFTVYYRDSEGRTVNQVKCRAQAAAGENEVLKELMR